MFSRLFGLQGGSRKNERGGTRVKVYCVLKLEGLFSLGLVTIVMFACGVGVPKAYDMVDKGLYLLPLIISL